MSKIKNEIKDEISFALDIEFIDSSYKHNYYTNSFINGDTAFIDGGYIGIDCMFFDEKDKKKFPNIVDNLSVTLSLNEINDLIDTGYK